MSRTSTAGKPAKQSVVLTGKAELLEMLTYKRPAFSNSERAFINRFLRPHGVSEDSYGNLYLRIGDAPILWSSHTDTVHDAGGKQFLQYAHDIVRLADSRSNCLGADCTAGVWLMLEMIRAKRPGLYVFHRAEEIGGKGSAAIAEDNPAMLEGIKYAVAFDRRDTNSVITHQWYGRCCSDTFAKSLASALQMGHSCDETGSFTDTANYTDLIGECTNLSVGYMREHTKDESLDVGYLMDLRDALVALEVATLEAERVPGEEDPDDYTVDYTSNHGMPGHFEDDNQEPEEVYSGTLQMLCRDHPDEVADWLSDYGITAAEVATAVFLRGGIIRRR